MLAIALSCLWQSLVVSTGYIKVQLLLIDNMVFSIEQ
jgi:hypothetical protein